jgi:hypothetical protein
MSGKLHAQAALPQRQESPVPIGQEDGWAPEPIWTPWRRENLAPTGWIIQGNCQGKVISPRSYILREPEVQKMEEKGK